MGIVIFSGLSIGTLFTLFVVPAMYLLLAGKHLGGQHAELPQSRAEDGRGRESAHAGAREEVAHRNR